MVTGDNILHEKERRRRKWEEALFGSYYLEPSFLHHQNLFFDAALLISIILIENY